MFSDVEDEQLFDQNISVTQVDYRGQFHQHSTSSISTIRLSSVFFTLSGSTSVKAELRTLMKLTPGVQRRLYFYKSLAQKYHSLDAIYTQKLLAN